ncbi:Conjugal transfer protein TraA [Candidatus Burkholderia verschuerenii]|uniref:Conjugal transfer protein TraA n=1 Tax=Candidatus Burkholderia verschuerenii TaxID=242163 RepID=A0A0L0MC76_9BURK|nr:MobF family relaxase [Candidatus Burkholderia verschuerenii]KND59865.1 Conjugal transfer protein TraA [Candidatus Burkholderia verschuerenii]
MLSITKINSAKNQTKKLGGDGYLDYLGAPSTRQRGDFDDYARGKHPELGPPPFWACSGKDALGLGEIAEPEQVERLSRGFHPLTGAPLTQGAGDAHVMGLDMTFSAPKDVSVVFAGADAATRAELVACLHEAARAALGYAEQASITRHGRAGAIRQFADASIAACYTHFASRALDPQLHVHAFLFNAGKRANFDEWSALEQRPQFDRKMATGALFRVELAARLRECGFLIAADGPYFQIVGVTDEQRRAMSKRSQEIAENLSDAGALTASLSAARDVAAVNTRSAKSEPPLPELLNRFDRMASELGLMPETVAAMRSREATPSPRGQTAERGLALGEETPERDACPAFRIDHAELLARLTEKQSCATPQEALALICEKAMAQWSAAECLAELDRFMEFERVVQLGMTERLTPVFTSRATLELEATISRRVRDGASNLRHRVDPRLVDARFDALETELRSALGVGVSLDQQRAAALHVVAETGNHVLVEGWAGTGKTTLLRAVAGAYQDAGFSVVGCCQSAAAAQNLNRETGVASRTIASLLLSIQNGRARLDERSILLLNEAGMVGSREFGLLQDAARAAGAKFIAVGDSKQLQPIEAGGIFCALASEHGAAQISIIRRQRTDFEPLFAWLEGAGAKRSGVRREHVAAMRALPDESKLEALAALGEKSAWLRQTIEKWRERFDHEWLRDAVELFATGNAAPALRLLDAHGRLRLSQSQSAAAESLVAAWAADKTTLPKKMMIAGTRAEVAELNARARAVLVERGDVRDGDGLEIEIKRRDDTTAIKRFAAGDRIVFTQNDRELGVAIGATGTIAVIQPTVRGPELIVALDDPNAREKSRVRIPEAFGRFDHAYCLTNAKSQGRTVDSAYVLANAMADREWTYVAASRSRFATTLFVDASAIAMGDPESHLSRPDETFDRDQAVDALARRMSRSRAKGTTLDYPMPTQGESATAQIKTPEPTRAPTHSTLEASTRETLSQEQKEALRELAGIRRDHPRETAPELCR